MSLINFSNPKAMVGGFIALIIGVELLVQFLPDVIGGIINLSGISNLAFSNFFAGGGIVLILVSVGILYGFLKMTGTGGKR